MKYIVKATFEVEADSLEEAKDSLQKNIDILDNVIPDDHEVRDILWSIQID